MTRCCTINIATCPDKENSVSVYFPKTARQVPFSPPIHWHFGKERKGEKKDSRFRWEHIPWHTCRQIDRRDIPIRQRRADQEPRTRRFQRGEHRIRERALVTLGVVHHASNTGLVAVPSVFPITDKHAVDGDALEPLHACLVGEIEGGAGFEEEEIDFACAEKVGRNADGFIVGKIGGGGDGGDGDGADCDIALSQ